MGLGDALGAVGGAAQGFAPAMGRVLAERQDQSQFNQREQRQRQYDNTNAELRERGLEDDREYQQATLDARTAEAERADAYRATEAAANNEYRIAGARIDEARLAIELERLRRTDTNSATDPRARIAEKAATELTRHMRERPVMDLETPPELFLRAIAQWEADDAQIARIHGFKDAEEIHEAMGGRPSPHNPMESGASALRRDMVRDAETASQRLMRLQEESGIESLQGYGNAMRSMMGTPADTAQVNDLLTNPEHVWNQGRRPGG